MPHMHQRIGAPLAVECRVPGFGKTHALVKRQSAGVLRIYIHVQARISAQRVHHHLSPHAKAMMGRVYEQRFQMAVVDQHEADGVIRCIHRQYQ